MLIACSNDDMDEEVRIIYEMHRPNVDGIILFASNLTDKHIKAINNLSMPLVIFGQNLPSHTSIFADVYEAELLMGSYIKNLNHEEISYLM